MRRRRRERNYWEGFRDALVIGHENPGVYEGGDLVSEQPGYQRGFCDGERAGTRMTRRARRGPCPRCHYIGNRHLCGCIAKIGEALEAGNLELARLRYQALVDAANEEERAAA